MIRAELVVSGLVQGVFYRASAQTEALRLGLLGEVRNLPGGEVEAIVEGPRAQVEAFIAWCRRGPEAARVDAVQVRWSPARGEFRSFRITR